MPVVLVFDSIPLLTASGTMFTNGNAASWGASRDGSIEFLRSIPFQKVYHDGAVKDREKRDIVFHRCAEVLVRDELPLAHLKHVLCRSHAEYETLMNILSENARAQFRKKIGVSGRVHFRRWTFVESVDLTHDRVNFRFNPSSLTPGPFDTTMELCNGTSTLVGRWHDQAYQANGTLAIGLSRLGSLQAYRVTLTFDGLLAYCGLFAPEETLL